MYKRTMNDDVFYCRKIGKAGWRVYVTNKVKLHHLTSATRYRKGRHRLYDELVVSDE